MTLTLKQYTIVMKIAKVSGMDCWFCIRQVPSGDDYVQDLETNRRWPLRQGLRDFAEGVTSYNGITESDVKIFEDLLDSLNIKKPEVMG